MATGLEQGLLMVSRFAAGSVFVAVFGLMAYGAGGYLFLVESVELAYPFLDLDRDPVLNVFITLAGIGLFITSLPLVLLATLFNQNGIDTIQVLLTTTIGAVGLALVELSVVNIV